MKGGRGLTAEGEALLKDDDLNLCNHIYHLASCPPNTRACLLQAMQSWGTMESSSTITTLNLYNVCPSTLPSLFVFWPPLLLQATQSWATCGQSL